MLKCTVSTAFYWLPRKRSFSNLISNYLRSNWKACDDGKRDAYENFQLSCLNWSVSTANIDLRSHENSSNGMGDVGVSGEIPREYQLLTSGVVWLNCAQVCKGDFSYYANWKAWIETQVQCQKTKEWERGALSLECCLHRSVHSGLTCLE